MNKVLVLLLNHHQKSKLIHLSALKTQVKNSKFKKILNKRITIKFNNINVLVWKKIRRKIKMLFLIMRKS